MKAICIALLSSALVGCQFVSETDDSLVLAELGNARLTYEDLQSQLPKAGTMASADSAAMVDRLVRRWAKNELLVQAAEFNLKDEIGSFEELVEQYRNDLLKHAFIEKYVRQNLDTAVNAEEVEAYYQANKANFELKESIVKAEFTAAPLSAKKVEDAKKWFKRTRDEDRYLEWIEVFATKQSAYSDSSWVPLDELLSDIPLETSNPYAFLRRNARFTCEDTAMVYFVEVNALEIENSYSPVEYVKERIRKMILNRRRLDLIEQIEENIIENAIEKGDLRIP
jgi:hypothetical protein